jgi:hypothetical protein
MQGWISKIFENPMSEGLDRVKAEPGLVPEGFAPHGTPIA